MTSLHRLPAAYRLWRVARGTAPVRWLRAALPDPRERITPRRLARHLALARTVADPSHAGEWPYLARLLGRLDLLDDGYAIDLAAGDGVRGSCTLPLFRDLDWAGLAIECDAVRFRLLAHAYRAFPRVRLASARVTPENAVHVLATNAVPAEPTLLNLDLDSFDLVVAERILAVCRPLVVDMEINEKVPPPLRFAVRYTPAHRWDGGHCYGCSLAAACDLLWATGYVLEGLEYNNAFFVRADVAALHGIVRASARAAYRAGYRARIDRHRLFPWNYDMEAVHALEPAAAIAFLERRFARYRGSYVLQATPLGGGWSAAAGDARA